MGRALQGGSLGTDNATQSHREIPTIWQEPSHVFTKVLSTRKESVSEWSNKNELNGDEPDPNRKPSTLARIMIEYFQRPSSQTSLKTMPL
jgi:hypothetical protein